MAYSYVIRTNLPPEQLNQIALEIFSRWVEFALGERALGGKRLIHPTGRYAASLEYRQEGEASVAMVSSSPIAGIIEHGHAAVDLKTKLQSGRAYPLHRAGGSPSMRPKMWAEMRRQSTSGFASFGPDSPADSWIIPAMPAYSPAAILAAQMQAMTDRIR